MSYTEIITCRVAIQVRVGYLPNGRARHRTFSMTNISPDASPEAIAAVVRALAPVLAYPITKVRKVVKRTIIFDEWKAPAAPAVAISLPVMPAQTAAPAVSEDLLWIHEGGEEEKFILMLLAIAWLQQLAIRQRAWGLLASLSLNAQAAQAVGFARVKGVSGRSPP